MKYGIYSIKDVKLGFMTPVYYPNDEVAVRDFKALSKQPNNAVSLHIEDKEFWKIGEFDDQFGIPKTVRPACLITGIDIVGGSHEIINNE